MAPGRLAILVAALVLVGCAETEVAYQRSGPADQGGGYKVGRPYKINGIWYYPAVDYDYDQTGIASWYGAEFDGRATANGETYDMNALTAAHRTLPMPSLVRVTNLENGRALALRVNDRGPYAHGRIVDVSRRAAQLLGFERQGTARVRVEVMADESRQIAFGAAPQTALLPGETKPQAAPRTAVTAAPLPGSTAGAATRPAASAVAAPRPALAPPPAPTGQVSVVPVRPTNLFIQAGAFSEVNNAHRLQARLSAFGPTRITPVRVDGQQFFRVRLGPLASVAEADRVLAQVVGSGNPGARIVVD